MKPYVVIPHESHPPFGGEKQKIILNPIALREAKIAYNFGLSECNRVKLYLLTLISGTGSVMSIIFFLRNVLHTDLFR